MEPENGIGAANNERDLSPQRMLQEHPQARPTEEANGEAMQPDRESSVMAVDAIPQVADILTHETRGIAQLAAHNIGEEMRSIIQCAASFLNSEEDSALTQLVLFLSSQIADAVDLVTEDLALGMTEIVNEGVDNSLSTVEENLPHVNIDFDQAVEDVVQQASLDLASEMNTIVKDVAQIAQICREENSARLAGTCGVEENSSRLAETCGVVENSSRLAETCGVEENSSRLAETCGVVENSSRLAETCGVVENSSRLAETCGVVENSSRLTVTCGEEENYHRLAEPCGVEENYDRQAETYDMEQNSNRVADDSVEENYDRVAEEGREQFYQALHVNVLGEKNNGDYKDVFYYLSVVGQVSESRGLDVLNEVEKGIVVQFFTSIANVDADQFEQCHFPVFALPNIQSLNYVTPSLVARWDERDIYVLAIRTSYLNPSLENVIYFPMNVVGTRDFYVFAVERRRAYSAVFIVLALKKLVDGNFCILFLKKKRPVARVLAVIAVEKKYAVEKVSPTLAPEKEDSDEQVSSASVDKKEDSSDEPVFHDLALKLTGMVQRVVNKLTFEKLMARKVSPTKPLVKSVVPQLAYVLAVVVDNVVKNVADRLTMEVKNVAKSSLLTTGDRNSVSQFARAIAAKIEDVRHVAHILAKALASQVQQSSGGSEIIHKQDSLYKGVPVLDNDKRCENETRATIANITRVNQELEAAVRNLRSAI